MNIRTLTVGVVGTHCYILREDGREDCVIIDPGDEAERIRRATEGRRIAGILLTHGHFDHIGAVRPLMEKEKERTGEEVPLLIHALDAEMLENSTLNAGAALLGMEVTAPPATGYLWEGERLTLAGLSIEVLHTPGHTPGSVCFRVGQELFTGDTLFAHGWGRTDLPGGSEKQMYQSLRRLMPLRSAYRIHPGHDD